MLAIRIILCYFIVINCISADYSDYKQNWLEFKVKHEECTSFFFISNNVDWFYVYRKRTINNMRIWRKKCSDFLRLSIIRKRFLSIIYFIVWAVLHTSWNQINLLIWHIKNSWKNTLATTSYTTTKGVYTYFYSKQLSIQITAIVLLTWSINLKYVNFLWFQKCQWKYNWKDGYNKSATVCWLASKWYSYRSSNSR